MSGRKERVTVTLDPAVVDAGNAAVAAGRAVSLSAWVNHALTDQVTKERRLAAGRAAIAMYEAEFGVITDEEVEAQVREDRRNALVVRGGKIYRPRKRTSRKT